MAHPCHPEFVGYAGFSFRPEWALLPKQSVPPSGHGYPQQPCSCAWNAGGKGYAGVLVKPAPEIERFGIIFQGFAELNIS